ncbi:hypothetical protein BGL34_03350 [Fructilactobacillus lindneri]|uniref:Uncharacterized protein n=2 Tax=Fructilactobacillus lindneri TaxID=53444 RepID=A0A0R2JS79_9LACO|nr:hypothetical protein [Fructilactobacillus lindneri]ANZ57836.1 hypothetical protein AYR60_03180 [Fructilactobacillus lindneri]ANZ59105.1 hypothetical protein AYR59_03180 [Fructilactobacillus lindneri]KRN78710.1 hypothetical protein IV52_GL000987 [Fructilactobacillus lindneri DSM 20690 = JCM 11027]POG98158.1 hypothetical protein BGL31_03510 [Fructilactobacillus lindneri]POH01726.1 hypothetical protein BGL32_03920 [Fructilactobacillus lindneri]
MGTGIPETMEQVHVLLAEMQQKGHQITEDELIYQTVQDLLQTYLDAAEEGHYDSVKAVNQQTLEIVSITGKHLGTYQTKATSLVDEFKNNAFKMTLDLEYVANKVVGGR